MPRKPSKQAGAAGDNVVLTKVAAQALQARFVGWQCRLRQYAVRQMGGRPSDGMRPRVTTVAGEAVADGIIVLISEIEPQDSTVQFRFQYLKTQDPNERFDKVLETLQGRYFQEPARFSDELTASFAPDSALAQRLVELGRCVLDFEQSDQGFRIPCAVRRLATTHPRYQATFWHNRLFNENLPPTAQVLMFTPDWAHARNLSADGT